jgi:hypothetical protein
MIGQSCGFTVIDSIFSSLRYHGNPKTQQISRAQTTSQTIISTAELVSENPRTTQKILWDSPDGLNCAPIVSHPSSFKKFGISLFPTYSLD